MNLYLIRSNLTEFRQVIADNYQAAIQMYISKYPELEEEDLDIKEIGTIAGCINGRYMISSSFLQWSEEKRIEE